MTTGKGTGFCPTHCELWTCCEQMAQQAEVVERGAFYFHMAEMLFAFFSYEAYLNFVGGFLVPNEWERDSSGNYRGIDDKLQLIERSLGFNIDRSVDPYHTVAGLEQLRHFISHGKPDNYTITSAAVKREPDFPFSSKLEQWVTPPKAKHAKEQVFELCATIHELAKSAPRLKSERRFGLGPFSAMDEAEWVP